MNTLSFEPIDRESYGFAGFRLLVDGAPIDQIPGCVFGELSYWEVGDDLQPIYPDQDPENCLRIVGVCDCGTAGCASTYARVTKTSQTVRMSDFSGRQVHELEIELTFSRRNYEEVLAQMGALAAQYELDDARRIRSPPCDS